jgi:glycosyltransferase involved in cell wall biosynthesis
MRIALVVPGGVDRTGEYRVIPALLSLLRRLASRHTVQVFALRQEPRPASWDLLGARVQNIGSGNARMRAVWSICAQHRRTPFDLIHSIWSGPCGLIAVCTSRILGLPSLVHVAGGEQVAIADIGYGGRLTWRGRLQEALVLRGAGVVTAASTGLIRTLRTLGCVARRVPLGADLDVWPPRAPERRDARRPARLVQVASLNRVKDQTTLLRALAALTAAGVSFEMDLIGEDTLGGEMQALCGSLGLSDRVRFHGFLPQSRLVPLVRAADVMVVSSRHEAGPLAVLEAAALGIPSVGTAVGHVAEWAPDAALAVEVGDYRALAIAIQRLVTDEELRLRLATNAAARSIEEDADFTAREFEALYRQALSGSL